MSSIEVHGAYKIRAPQPCYIVEITVRESERELKFSDVVFKVKIDGRVTKQVPFEEHFLSPDGTEILGNFTYAWHNDDAWCGDVRLAFLMHYLEPGGTIETPYGNIIIPEASEKPERLKSLKYVSPY